MPTSSDLASIISRTRAGQSQAMSELYEAFAELLFRYCCARLNDREAAQDCVQEAFIRVWRGIKTFDYRGDPSFTGWLYTITNHVVVSYIRRRGRSQAMSLDGDLPLVVAQPFDLAGSVCDRLALYQALSRLTNEQQRVIVLKFFVGLSNHETAAVIHRTEGAVKALQYRALSRLAQLLVLEQAPAQRTLELSSHAPAR
jgi:RNA polymerase sigma-70 factor (ECF subfamily)